MTREEQIKAAAKKTTGLFSYRNGYSTAEDAFIAGAEWAGAKKSTKNYSIFEIETLKRAEKEIDTMYNRLTNQ